MNLQTHLNSKQTEKDYKDIESGQNNDRARTCAASTLFFPGYYWLLFFGITVPFLAGDRWSRFLYDMCPSRVDLRMFFPVLSRMSCFGVAVDFSWLGQACSISSVVSSSFFVGRLNPRFSERSLPYCGGR